MGVYIPNMEMPKHCTECYFVCRDQCELQDNSYDYDTFKEQKKHCPLIEIPTPHGRLIDANKLEAMMYHEAFEVDSDMQKWDSGCWIRYKVFENCMSRLLPDTILEAEE